MNFDKQAELWLELSNQTFNSVVNIGEVFEIATDEERRKLMKMLGSNWYLGNKKVVLTPRKPLDVLHVDNRKNGGNLVWRAVALSVWNYFTSTDKAKSLLLLDKTN